MVRSLFSTVAAQKAWVLALGQRALIGTTTGIDDVLSNLQDWSASNVSNEGASTQWLREISAPAIASMCEAALRVIEADEAAGGVGKAPQGNVRGIDFSSMPCVMG